MLSMDEGTQHRRDVLAIMMAILASHDGIASAKATAVACWEEATRLATILSEPADGPTGGTDALRTALTGVLQED